MAAARIARRRRIAFVHRIAAAVAIDTGSREIPHPHKSLDGENILGMAEDHRVTGIAGWNCAEHMAGTRLDHSIFKRGAGDALGAELTQHIGIARRAAHLPTGGMKNTGQACPGVSEAKTEQPARSKRAMIGGIHAAYCHKLSMIMFAHEYVK